MKTPEQTDEEFECQKCHASVQLGDGLIPTKYCNLCAQELVESMGDRLQAAESRLAEWETLRTNDAATHQNILRGIIALTRPQALHLAGAQDYDELKDRLQAVEAESKSRRKEIASLDEQLAEAKRAIETQYNLRQAVEAERDRYKAALERIQSYGDCTSWDIAQQALQPAQKESK